MNGTTAEVSCALCGLRCRDRTHRRTHAERELLFCCAGCMNVYAILLEGGLVEDGADLRETELYRRSLALGLVSGGAAPDGAGAAPGSGPPAARPSADAAARPTREISLGITGMWCGSCAWLIEHALEREPGVRAARVAFASDLATVRFCPMEIAPERIRARIESLGYRVRAADETDARRQADNRKALLRLGIAAFLWLNVMTLNMAIYVGYFERLPESIAARLPLVLLVLSAPAVFYCAWPILHLAWRGLTQGLVRTEALLALGIVCSWGYSAVMALRGGRHVYFDTACAIVVLVLLGKWIERSAKEKARRALARLYSMQPSKARLVDGTHEHFVAIEAVRPGDLLLVKAGERFPADGVVTEGESHADESMLTGEAIPVAKRIGDAVVAGSVNAGSVLRVRATLVGDASTLARLVQMVERALAGRSNVERLADRVTRVFIPAVLLLSLGTFAGWHWGAGLALPEAVQRAVAVLVIACPCALGIAAPLAITAAVGAASRRGILVSDSSVLETVEHVDVLVLDKTGTVTEEEVVLLEADERHLGVLASLEAVSEHPLGRAVVAGAQARGLATSPATDVEIHKGRGIRGHVAGCDVRIGTRSFVGRAGHDLEARARLLEEQGTSVVFYAWDGEVRGLLALGSRVRAGAAELVAGVQRMGVRVSVLSGDSEAATAWVARAIGADTHRSEVLPEEKAGVVRELRDAGAVVAMVGDGVNDAPALAAANLGIAMGSGTDLAMSAAAVTLTCNSLPRVLDIFALSRRTLGIVRQNLFWAFAYNSLGLGLAAAGRLHPIAAAAAMVVSSLCVVLNSARLLGQSADAPEVRG